MSNVMEYNCTGEDLQFEYM